MKKIFSIGKHIQTVINYGLKLNKAIRTFESLIMHLQSFEVDRQKIWGVENDTPIVEQKA